MRSLTSGFPDDLPKVETHAGKKRPVSIHFDDELILHLEEAQADNLFSQLGQSAKQIEAAK